MLETHPSLINRRDFFARSSTALAGTAFASLLQADGLSDNLSHYAPKAKRVIYLYMSGGPSQFESFDDKPELRRRHNQPIPADLTKGVKLAFLQNDELKCFGTDVGFKLCGNSGQNISNLLPHLQELADELCIIRTQQTDQVNHDPAHAFMNTGTAIAGRPSMGSWVTYGLGRMSENLPAFVVMRSGPEGQPVPQTAWNAGFLPGKHSGVEFYSKGVPLNYLESPAGIARSTQRQSLDTLSKLNTLHHDQVGRQTLCRIAALESHMEFQLRKVGGFCLINFQKSVDDGLAIIDVVWLIRTVNLEFVVFGVLDLCQLDFLIRFKLNLSRNQKIGV